MTWVNVIRGEAKMQPNRPKGSLDSFSREHLRKSISCAVAMGEVTYYECVTSRYD